MQGQKIDKGSDEYINDLLRNYSQLTQDQKSQCNNMILNAIKQQMTIFKERIKVSGINLQTLNLILGTTGAGKSTLFNYLNQIPLKVSVKKIRNTQGVLIESSEATLLVDQQELRRSKLKAIFASISSGYTSQTTIPNFCQSKTSNVAYVDCAGQFDNKDILQSIINSFFKYDLAKKAKKVKLTIVFNYHALLSERGNAFKKLIKQVSNFVGMWDEFSTSKCVSFVVTNAPRAKNIKQSILAQLNQMAKQVKDLGSIKILLEDIINRKALAVFLKPPKKKPNKDESDNQEEDKYQNGAAYIPNQMIGKNLVSSPQIITKTLQETSFINAKPDLFVQNLQFQAKKVVDLICFDLLDKLSQSLLNIIRQQILDNATNQVQKVAYFQEQKMKFQKCKNLQEMIQIFDLKPEKLADYTKKSQQFRQFQEISNIVNAEKELLKSREKLLSFINNELTSILLADNKQRDRKLQQYRLSLQQQKKKAKKKQKQAQQKLKEHLEEKKRKQQESLQLSSQVCDLKILNIQSVNGEWYSQICLKNQSDLIFDTIYIKHGANFSKKDNIQFLKPRVVQIKNVPFESNSTFKLPFFSEGPSKLGNLIKIFGLGITNIGWGKDYWQIEGIVNEGGFRVFTTTRSDWYYTDIEKGDLNIQIRIKNSNIKGQYFVEFSRLSGLNTRDFQPATYGNINSYGWSY